MKTVKYHDVKLSPSDAFDMYVEKYPGTTVKEVELELKSNSYVYKIEGYDDEKKYEIYVDPVDGTIRQVKESLYKRIYKEINKESLDKIQEVLDKALEEAGENSVIYKWSLEMEDEKLELTLRIDLANGQRVKYKYDLSGQDAIKL